MRNHHLVQNKYLGYRVFEQHLIPIFQRLISFLDTGLMPAIDGDPIPLEAHSICVHGDSETAVSMAREVKRYLIEAKVTVEAFIAP